MRIALPLAAVAALALALWWLSADDPTPVPRTPRPETADPAPGPAPADPPRTAGTDDAPQPAPPATDGPDAPSVDAVERPEAFGTVRDADGRPIQGATVAAIDEGRVLRHTKTDREGRYDLGSFPDVDDARKRTRPMGFPAAFRLFAKAPGRATVAEPVRPGGPTDFVLPPTTAIVGQFVDPAGASPGAFAVDVRPVPIVAGTSHRIETDSTGAFRVEVPPGNWVIDGHAPGRFHDRTVVAAVAGRETRVTIRLDPAIRVSGRVVDSVTREPVAGASVVLRYTRVTTDADGHFAFDDVPTRVVDATSLVGQLAVTAKGYARHTLTPPVEGGDDVELELAIDRYASVDGRLVDADGAPVAGASIGLRSDTRGPGAKTDLDGRFRLERCRPEAWQLVTRVSGHAPYRSTVFTLAPGETRTTVCTLASGAPLTVTVRDSDGEPIWRAGVTAIPLAGAGGERQVRRARHDGVAAFDTLTAGVRYRLVVEADGYAPTATELVAGVPPAAHDVVLGPGAALRGRVVVTGDAPTAGVRVEARPLATRHDFLLNRPRTAAVADDGAFAFESLAPGNWIVSVVATEKSLVDAEPTVAAPGDDLVLAARIYAPLAIEGVVVDATDGAPVDDHRIFLSRLDGETPAHDDVGVARTTPDGRFRLDGLAAGTWAVAATTRDGRSTRAPVRVVLRPGDPPGHARLVVARAPVATVRGRVTGAGGTPIDRGDRPIDVEATAVDRAHPTRVRTRADATGVFSVDLPIGRAFRLVARHPRWTGVPHVVTPAGNDAPIALEMVENGATLRCTLLDDSGVPLARVRVDVRAPDGARVAHRHWLGSRAAWHAHRVGDSHRAYDALLRGTITDDRGRLERPDLEPGSYTLCVPGFRPEPVDVRVDGPARTIRLRPQR